MTERSERNPNAEAQARHREGVAHQLKAIRSAIEDMRADVKQVLATRMVRKSISNSECRNGD